MKTANGYKFQIKNEICTLLIPKVESEFTTSVQQAKRQIISNWELPYFKEIKIKKY